MVKQLIIGLSMLLLSGCVTGNYQSFKSSVGYVDEHEKDNIYVVSYTGTPTTKVEIVNDFVLLRSAEVTLDNGYSYFVIEEASNNKDKVAQLSNGTASISDQFSRNGYGSARSRMDDAVKKVRPKSVMKIHCFKEKPEDTIVYDAVALERALKDEYQIEEPTQL